jgi:hypothetical protein
MRRLILLIGLFATPAAIGQPQLQVPPTAPVFSMDAASGGVVLVLQDTYIRSGPSKQAYPCHPTLKAGDRVKLLKAPAGGSEWAIIEPPETCYSLVPASALESGLIVKRKLTQFNAEYPILTKPGIKPFLDGEVPPGGSYAEADSMIPKGAQVFVVGAKSIIVGTKRIECYVIKPHGQEKRYVLVAHLQGVQTVPQPAFNPATPAPDLGSLPAATPPAQMPRNPLTDFQNPPAAVQTAVQDQLPPEVDSQVRAAEQAYLQGMRYSAWEDARMRYVHLLDSDIASVRILAINRLEFIKQCQANPQIVSAARLPQDVPPRAAPPPPVNGNYWVPGGQAAVPAATTTANPTKPIKDVKIRPEQPVNPPANPSNARPPVPTYPPAGTATPQPPVGREPARGQLASTANALKKEKRTGRLYRAVQNEVNPLYYLVNSQGTTTYYVRAWTHLRLNLDKYVGKNVEVEGQIVDRRQDELRALQINVEKIVER